MSNSSISGIGKGTGKDFIPIRTTPDGFGSVLTTTTQSVEEPILGVAYLSTAFAESTVNWVVSKRMVKK